jgi:hypothetical protein
MKHDTYPDHHRQHDRSGQSERMKGGQNAENAVVLVESEGLLELRDVGDNIVVGEKDAFGIARTPPRKDHRCEIHGYNLPANESRCQQRPRREKCAQPFIGRRLRGRFFEKDGLARNVDFDALKERFRCDHRLDGALRTHDAMPSLDNV